LFKHTSIKVLSVTVAFLGVSLLFCFRAKGQDYHFTQFYANKLYLAPSFAGSSGMNRFIGNYRDQWPGVKGYTTFSASFDKFFPKFNSGLGVLIMRDVAGDASLGTLKAGLCYSYDFKVTGLLHMRPGISMTYLNSSYDYSKLEFSSDLGTTNTTVPTNTLYADNTSISGLDVAVSALAYTPKWWVGTTIDHLLRPNLSFLQNEDPNPIKYVVFSGVTLYRQSRLLKPIDETMSLACQIKGQKNFMQADLGIYWARIPLIFGLWYRGIPLYNSERGDAISLLVGYRRYHFSFGYSYDFTISNLVNKSNGAHEISMSYEFTKYPRKKKKQAVPCPEF
jgi:type IX secretion system PorP/SprF family membrane protein